MLNDVVFCLDLKSGERASDVVMQNVVLFSPHPIVPEPQQVGSRNIFQFLSFVFPEGHFALIVHSGKLAGHWRRPGCGKERIHRLDLAFVGWYA